ncbi:MAG TPA: Gfo/Idh/MocA family oxidoreductase, partial [Candidatus Limnocylindrales bacterium]|nr:Gfo/Idh/MocA family oxidoreductase [Candidatus Limnocylindrales bacterium]
MATLPLPHPIGIAIVGSGDVARRRYLPALATLGDRVEVVALVDRSPAAADAATAIAASTWPRARAFGSLADAAAAAEGLDAAVNLTPAPLHAAVTTEA